MAVAKKGRAAPGGRKRKTAPRARRLRRSREDILKRIVEAATEEFKRCGYAAATTASVASKAGVTEAQLFRYFGSKANLFRETIFNPVNLHLKNFLAERFPDGASEPELREIYTQELRRFISQHASALTSLVFAETYRNGPEFGVSGIDSLRTYFERGAALMRRRTRGRRKIDPELFVRISFVTVLGCVMFKQWVFPPGTASDAQVDAALSDFINLAIAGNAAGGVA